MLGGYMGRILWVDLTAGTVREEPLDEGFCRKFLGGYGFAMRIIYDRQKAGVDPLSPEAVAALVTGPLTGTPAILGTRYTVAAKSPLTGTWGDANSGGRFGPVLKQAGFDGVFFTGASRRPVYLLLEQGKARLMPAESLWGRDALETEASLKGVHGAEAEVAAVGPAGEKGVMYACVVTDRGRVAARYGLGAVLGAKKVKAVVARGDAQVALADPERARELRKKYTDQFLVQKIGAAAGYLVGTPGYTRTGALNGDSPVKNWRGACGVDFTLEEADRLDCNKLFAYRFRKYGCWRCPVSCGGLVSVKSGPFAVEETHQPEYETMAAYGSNCGNSDLESIIKASDVCNRLGIDTISAGSLVAFAIECYEKGLLTEKQVGFPLAWGDGEAIVRLTEMIGRREGIGDLLAQGLEKAAEAIGGDAPSFAVHVRGEAVSMHDPRFEPAMAVIYKMHPGKHIQASQYCKPPGLLPDIPDFGADRTRTEGRGRGLRILEALCNVVNCAGLCLFGYLSTELTNLTETMEAVTGASYTLDDLVTVGERIANMRQAFNLREGADVVASPFPPRALGVPPLEAGPTKGFTADMDSILRDFLAAMDWAEADGRPSRAKLESLGLEDLVDDLHPSG